MYVGLQYKMLQMTLLLKYKSSLMCIVLIYSNNLKMYLNNDYVTVTLRKTKNIYWASLKNPINKYTKSLNFCFI